MNRVMCQCLGVLSLLVICAPTMAQEEEAAIKDAFLKYMQARIDRDVDAARAVSTGDDATMAALEADIARQAAMDRFNAAAAKLEGMPAPASQPAKQTANEVFGHFFDSSEITIEGDTAIIKPKQAGPMQIPGTYMRKVDGAWKRDISQGDASYAGDSADEMRQMAQTINDVTAQIESGQIKNREQLEAAVGRARGGATTRPTTQMTH